MLMRLLIIALVIGAVGLTPFVMLRRSWALRVWEKVKLLLVAYVIVMIIASIFWLINRWDSIYG